MLDGKDTTTEITVHRLRHTDGSVCLVMPCRRSQCNRHMATQKGPAHQLNLTLLQKSQLFCWFIDKNAMQRGFHFSMQMRHIIRDLFQRKRNVDSSVVLAVHRLAKHKLASEQTLQHTCRCDLGWLERRQHHVFQAMVRCSNGTEIKIHCRIKLRFHSDSVQGRT